MSSLKKRDIATQWANVSMVHHSTEFENLRAVIEDSSLFLNGLFSHKLMISIRKSNRVVK